ncbi:MAG: (2Fe-2S)-binding protein [Myxococcota bacterium]
MPRFEIVVNGQRRSVDAPGEMPLVWVLRDLLGLTGTKFGCGIGQCRACTVHMAGEPAFACQIPLSRLGGRPITTIEGLSTRTRAVLEEAWLGERVSQCGYCQPGQLMGAAALLAKNPKPSDADIDVALSGNLCRCGTYVRIRKAVHRAAKGQRR